MEYQPYSIRQLLDSVSSGSIRIPAFQRGFVWDMDRVAYLMDSIYKRYPFGSLLFWRTKSKLAIERKLGVFELPTPKEDYPIDYVLDGQQRLTSIFSVFQTELKPTLKNEWTGIYFDNDIEEATKLKNGENSSFGEIDCKVDKDFFVGNQFHLSNANTKTFILMLANNIPKSFVSGSLIDLDKVLQKYNKPSEYVKMMPKGDALKDILDRALCPIDGFDDNFAKFIDKRAELLAVFAKQLIEPKMQGSKKIFIEVQHLFGIDGFSNRSDLNNNETQEF